MKLLSIIIPCRNGEKWIPLVTESIIHSDLKMDEYEIVFVDDVSEDDTLFAMQKLKSLYPNIQIIAVLCYPNELQYLKCAFTDFLMPPEIEAAPKRACIVTRNRWVADHSDYIVCFIKYKMGGAYAAVEYAQKHHKQIIEVRA